MIALLGGSWDPFGKNNGTDSDMWDCEDLELEEHSQTREEIIHSRAPSLDSESAHLFLLALFRES